MFLGFSITNYQSPITTLFNFFMRRVLAAPVAELLQFQTIRRRFAVLRLRIVPLFAVPTLQRDNFAHCPLPKPALDFDSVGTGASPVQAERSSAPHNLLMPQSRRSCRLPPCGRLRGLRSASLFPS